MVMLADLLNAGQTPWAQAQHFNWNNPGSEMTEAEMAKMLGINFGGGQSAPMSVGAPASGPPLKKGGGTPLPPPPTEPTAHELPKFFERRQDASQGAEFPAGSMLGNIFAQYGAGAGFKPEEAGVPTMPSSSFRDPAPPAASAPMQTSSVTPQRPQRRPDFSNEPTGSDYLGGLLQGMGGIAAPVGKLISSQSDRKRIEQSQNKTYDWLMKQGMSPEDAEFTVRNPEVLKHVLTQKFKQPDPTESMRNYLFDIQQRNARGTPGPHPTLGEWMAQQKQAGRTQVSIDQRHESEFGKKLAAQEAERYGSIIKAGSAARDMVGNLDVVGAALDAYNRGSKLGTGALGPYEHALRSYGAALGIGDAETVGAGELAQSIQNRMALMMRNPDGGMGMPGALSDADRKFLVASQPGIDKTPAGNRRMIEIMKRLEQRKIQISEMAAEWVGTNGTMKGFEQHVNKWANANPLFGDLQEMFAPKRTGGGDGASSFASPQLSGALPSVRNDDDYNALQPGAEYLAPDGSLRRKN